MSLPVTTEALIASAQRRAFMPTSGTALTATDWLNILNEEVQGYLVPFLTRFRKNFFLTTATIPLVAGQADYPLPTRALASRFLVVQMLDGSGNPNSPNLTPMPIEDALAWPSSSFVGGAPGSYAIKNEVLTLIPTPQAGSIAGAPTLRVAYFQRPSQLVLSTSVATITAAAQVGGSFTVSYAALPTGATFSTSTALESVHANSGYETTPLGTPTAVTATQATFTGTLPATLLVGDTLCLQDQANVVTYVPSEFAWLLVQKVALEATRSRGDDARVDRLKAGLADAEANARALLSKRDSGANDKLRNGRTTAFGSRMPFYFR